MPVLNWAEFVRRFTISSPSNDTLFLLRVGVRSCRFEGWPLLLEAWRLRASPGAAGDVLAACYPAATSRVRQRTLGGERREVAELDGRGDLNRRRGAAREADHRNDADEPLRFVEVVI